MEDTGWRTIDATKLLGGMIPNMATPTPAGAVDPYQLMLQKKRGDVKEEEIPPNMPKWPEADVKALQDYCAKMGIVGFNSGRMPPIAALAMLKKQLGDDYTGVPLEDRVPEGYERRGTVSGNTSYPYSAAAVKKQILHG